MRARGLLVAVLCVAFTSSCSLSADRRAQHRHSRGTARRPAPTSTTQPPTTTTGPPFVYRVRPGDSLNGLAARFRVPVTVLMRRNHLTNANLLHEGQVLHIPSAPPLSLSVTPSQGRAGQAFRLQLTGAEPSETITFTIVSPAGRDTGAPHTTANGTVTATYQTAIGDPPGVRTVFAAGDMGTRVTATFVVTAAPASQ